MASSNSTWTIKDARALYSINRWGSGYFDIDESGNVIARPLQDEGASVIINELIEQAQNLNLHLPLLIRFQDILHHRVKTLNLAFQASIQEYQYQGKYRGVFPVKVNQLREVIEEILDAGKPYDFGLEVGSKPELFAALALQARIDSMIICNGYKDPKYIKIALMGKKLGKNIILVIEKLEELIQIISIAREVGVEPIIGIRLRLLSKGSGKWANSGGENAKFGLSTAELIAAAQILEKEDMANCLQLLHFHIGSQIPDILTIKKAVQESARFYAKLHKMGFPIKFIDVGGGLGVDYDGSKTVFDSSTNYTLQEYTNDIVYYIGEICNAEETPHPDIISESGRALVAHHSVLIVEAFGSIGKVDAGKSLVFGSNEHDTVKELLEIRDNLDNLNKLEAYHDALDMKEEAYNMFTLGLLDLPDKAKIDHLYWQIGKAVGESFQGQSYIPEEILALKESLSDQYVCNFSVFQSLLDHWSLGQLFPIMPISRLDERPSHEATLVDITCDSDGQINKFIDLIDSRNTLSLHDLKQIKYRDEPYYLGLFLIGAYQDIMGDLHNLFGRVNEVHVFLDPDEVNGYYMEEIIEGNTVVESLATVQYDAKELKRQMKAQVDQAINEDRLKPSEGMRLLKEYEQGLRDYTYLAL
jgi:arginine decarboxylase